MMSVYKKVQEDFVNGSDKIYVVKKNIGGMKHWEWLKLDKPFQMQQSLNKSSYSPTREKKNIYYFKIKI